MVTLIIYNCDLSFQDTTEYYNIEYISKEDGGANHWIHLDASDSNVVKHTSLQKAYRLAVVSTSIYTNSSKYQYIYQQQQ